MSHSAKRHFTHTDIKLLRARMQLTSGQRLQAMLDAHAFLVGIIRGRLRRRYPDLTDREINLKVVEEIERAQGLGEEVVSVWELLNESAQGEATRHGQSD